VRTPTEKLMLLMSLACYSLAISFITRRGQGVLVDV
jgi:hypothetical protein